MDDVYSDKFIALAGDCLKKLSEIPDNYIDCIITDLPYGITQNKWDIPIDLPQLWTEYKRVIKTGGNIILFGIQPFTSQLVLSNIDMFKYEVIWEKTIGSGQLNIKRQPLRIHENILIYYDKQQTYNEQFTKGKPYTIRRKSVTQSNYNAQSESNKINTGYRHPKTIIKISNPRIKGGHPTEKPVELLELLVRTYSNPGDKILDSCMGMGSTGVAAIMNDRKFVGIELIPEYYQAAIDKLSRL